MTLPTTKVPSIPIRGPATDKNGYFTEQVVFFLQLLYNRVGGPSAPTNNVLASSITSSVAGPASSVDGDIALFSGTTGKVIQDGGFALSSLTTEAEVSSVVPHASPFVDSIMQQRVSDLESQLVDLRIPLQASTGASFSANNNSVAQSIPNAANTKLTFSTNEYNVGGAFSSSKWTPPSRLVMLSGAVSLPTTALSITYVSIYKNGVEFKRGVQVQSPNVTANSAVVTCMDIANGSDYYELWAFQSTGGAANTNAAPSLTYFQGSTVSP